MLSHSSFQGSRDSIPEGNRWLMGMIISPGMWLDVIEASKDQDSPNALEEHNFPQPLPLSTYVLYLPSNGSIF